MAAKVTEPKFSVEAVKHLNKFSKHAQIFPSYSLSFYKFFKEPLKLKYILTRHSQAMTTIILNIDTLSCSVAGTGVVMS